MRPKNTAQLSKTQNLACTTEKPSAALKNTSKLTSKFHERGLLAEHHVRKFFLLRGWSISSERTKYDGVEVDIIVEKEKRRVLLEVKYLDNSWRVFERVGAKQIQRLKYVLFGMRRRERHMKIEGYIVFVLRDGKLHFVSLDETL